MLIDIPVLRRCCFCMPLRRGIIVFGWLTLVVTCMSITIQVISWQREQASLVHTVGLYRGVMMEAHLIFLMILYILDLIFNVLLIVGAHMKNGKLLRVYYYYQLTTMVASLSVTLISYNDLNQFGGLGIALTEIGVVITAFVAQIYILLLIRSELNKVKYLEGRSSYVNNAAEVILEPPRRRDQVALL